MRPRRGSPSNIWAAPSSRRPRARRPPRKPSRPSSPWCVCELQAIYPRRYILKERLLSSLAFQQRSKSVCVCAYVCLSKIRGKLLYLYFSLPIFVVVIVFVNYELSEKLNIKKWQSQRCKKFLSISFISLSLSLFCFRFIFIASKHFTSFICGKQRSNFEATVNSRAIYVFFFSF